MIEIIIGFNNEDASELLIKHGFIKVKRHWELKSSHYKFSAQEALQALCISIVSNAIRGKKKILPKPPSQ